VIARVFQKPGEVPCGRKHRLGGPSSAAGESCFSDSTTSASIGGGGGGGGGGASASSRPLLTVTVTDTSGEEVVLGEGAHTVAEGTEYVFPEGASVPRPEGLPELGGERWSTPLLNQGGHPLFETWSTLLALTFGCMGLPHVIMRFHTSPTARVARRVAVVVIALLGMFYLFPTVYGLLGRALTPQLVLLQGTDTVAVVLPDHAVSGSVGTFLTALVAAGAFGAFLSTSSGLLLALAGGLSHDLFRSNVPRLRMGITVGACVAVLLALPAQMTDINVLVVWAFTVAASTFCPLLVLGIWWRRLTLPGAAAGLIVGAVTATGAVGWSVLLPTPGGWVDVLLAQPAAWTIPLAFVTMMAVSRFTRPPEWAEHAVLRLHAP